MNNIPSTLLTNVNKIHIGLSGSGKSFTFEHELLQVLDMQRIVNNRLNNNNWLKKHHKPLIRKGHIDYLKCKKWKDMNPFEIIVTTDSEEKYEKISQIIKNRTYNEMSVILQKGDNNTIETQAVSL